MNAERKAEWVAALRSGDYQQGKNSLIQVVSKGGTEDVAVRYCCLGVACDLAVRAGVINPPDEKDTFAWTDDTGVTRYEAGVLPDPVREWLGLGSDNPIPGSTSLALSEWNDNGHSFAEIADVIEAEL